MARQKLQPPPTHPQMSNGAPVLQLTQTVNCGEQSLELTVHGSIHR